MRFNRHGLSRTIDASTKRAVRQRCGFGCVKCGCGIVQYHHFDPPFAEATRHDAAGITLLCGQCHDRAERQILSFDDVVDANRSPWCRTAGYTKDFLFLGAGDIPVRFGSSCVRATTIIKCGESIVVGMSRPEVNGSPLRFNAVLTDPSGLELLRVIDNEWQAGCGRYDIRTTGDSLTIHDAQRDVVLDMSLSTGKEILIRRLRMTIQGVSIVAKEGSFELTLPTGGTFRHNGDIVADVGIWIKPTGEVLVAATELGGAAIRLGP